MRKIICEDCGVIVTTANNSRKLCVKCAKERRVARDTAYRASHKEKIAAYNASHREEKAVRDAAYRASHKEKIAAYDAAYSASHKVEIAACSAAYYVSHKEERAAYSAAYRASHKDEEAARHAAYQRVPEARARRNLTSRRRAQAKRETRDFFAAVVITGEINKAFGGK